MGLDEELLKAKADLEARPALAPEDFKAGLAWLKGKRELDLFFKETSAEALMQQPLGPEAQCLSIEALELSLKEPAPHIANCEHCTANLKLMKELQAEAVARAPAIFGLSH